MDRNAADWNDSKNQKHGGNTASPSAGNEANEGTQIATITRIDVLENSLNQ